jgi:hypothetical protein
MVRAALGPKNGAGDDMQEQITTTQELFGGNELAPLKDPYPIYRRLRRDHHPQRLGPELSRRRRQR